MAHQLTLSFELICFLDWLTKNRDKNLCKLVKEAIDDGLFRDLQILSDEDSLSITQKLHAIVIDFVVFLEDVLLESLEDAFPKLHHMEKIKSVLPLVDNEKLDDTFLWLSVQQAKWGKPIGKKSVAQDDQDDPEVAQEFFKQILKNWKPASNQPIN